MPRPLVGEAVLATWSQLLDLGLMQQNEPFLAGTAHRPVVRLSAATAQGVGVVEGQPLNVSTKRGTITLPARITAMPDHVVWLPTNSPGSTVRATLGAVGGDLVRLTPGEALPQQTTKDGVA
ncbi:hypothetical protein GCM10025872_04470 [Barrientosiimonas endolithica]|uniref:Molybdopterin dinucleotide-binding domain-containing protein n=1 Tax=Barrientosiimonas endolithica TaxID=1535208 RepID=A0ABM8H7N9_9MICO|nr:hypothetical protein GCM10025872_04470 [Barrientosiimonas endolithica]